MGTQERNDRFPIQGSGGTGRDYRFLILPALQKIRGRSAEDMHPMKVLEDEDFRVHGKALGVASFACSSRGACGPSGAYVPRGLHPLKELHAKVALSTFT